MELTIFTPTYNRAYCLPKLFQSLQNQTIKQFTWLIIDDGSSDGTEKLVNTWQKNSNLTIRYVKQKNSGKHVATQRAIGLIDADYFICVDSDDELVANAVQIIRDKCEEYKEIDHLGFYFKKIDKKGGNLASNYPSDLQKVGITDLYHKYNFVGDTAIVLKTKYCKKVIWPVFENERFVTERVFYNQLNHFAPMILCEEEICICDYLPDGYTKNLDSLISNNPYGHAVGILSDSLYTSRFINKIKKYSEYKGIKKVYNLSDDYLQKYDNTCGFIKFLSIFFVPHYVILYGKKRVCK